MPHQDFVKKLAKLNSTHLPIFSLFLKVDRKDQPLVKVKTILKNLLKTREKYFETHAQKIYFKRISQKITDYIEQNIPRTQSHGIAIYAGGDSDIFEVIELSLIPQTVQNILITNHEPFLDIFDFYDKKYKKFALVITNERLTNIFIAQGNDLVLIESCKIEITQKTDKEGVFRSGKGVSWGGTAEKPDEKIMDFKKHFKKINKQLANYLLTEKFNALILAGNHKILSIFEKELSKNLQKTLVEKWDNDLTKLDKVALLKKIKAFEKTM